MNCINTSVLNELEAIIHALEMQVKLVENMEMDEKTASNLDTLSKKVNRTLYMADKIELKGCDSQDIREKLKASIPVWKQSIENRRGLRIDNEFWTLYDYFKYVDGNSIVLNALNTFLSYSDEYKYMFTSLPQRYTFLEGTIDITTNNYSLIPMYVDMMKDHLDDFEWLYHKLADYRSKKILIEIVNYWITYNIDSLHALKESIFPEYYDSDILTQNPQEVFVDCGAFTGDSIQGFIDHFGHYRRIYGYEMMPETMQKMRNNLSQYENIEYMQKGVGCENTTLFVEGENAGAHVSDKGSIEVPIVSLDNDIAEQVTMIKMDIEGAEQDALKGAKRHISVDRPRLLVCTYHRPADIFEIPRLIDSMRNDYSYYLRINGMGIWPVDHVIFAV